MVQNASKLRTASHLEEGKVLLSTSSLTDGLSLHFWTETRSISTGELEEEEGGTENALEEGGTDRRGI